jgi:hypothetical protein
MVVEVRYRVCLSLCCARHFLPNQELQESDRREGELETEG